MSQQDPSITRLKDACAKVECSGPGGSRLGTGFLVATDRVVTVDYVVRASTTISARFGEQVLEAVNESVGDGACAVLRLKEPFSGAQPLPLSSECTSGTFVTYGFPSVVGDAGLLLRGEILDLFGKDPMGEPAIVLKMQAAIPMQGYGGSPIVADDNVIGILRRTLVLEDGGVTPIAYAYPVPLLAGSIVAPAKPRYPTKTSMRALMETVFLIDDYLNAFCFDEFPVVHKLFTANMAPAAKITLLFQHNTTKDILARLREHEKDVAKHEHLLKYQDDPT